MQFLAMLEGRKPDYFVRAVLSVGSSEYADIPCEVYLPDSHYEKPYLVFKPVRCLMDAGLLGLHSASFQAMAYRVGDSDPYALISATSVYFDRNEISSWGNGLTRDQLGGEPQDLSILFPASASVDTEETEFIFRITRSAVLAPICWPHLNWGSGEIRYEQLKTYEFVLEGDTRVIFQNGFSAKTLSDGSLVQNPQLVAKIKARIDPEQIDQIKDELLQKLDDFLLVASFVERARIVCVGWDAIGVSKKGSFYRGSYAFPDKDEPHDLRNAFVDKEKPEEYLRDYYRGFLDYSSRQVMRTCLSIVVSLRNEALEPSFLMAFSALEALILEWKRSAKQEFILADVQWPSFRCFLQKQIKAYGGGLEKEKRATIYKKLPELNRPSLDDSAKAFFENHKLFLDDLWPLFKENGIVGLSEIRNKLIHGDSASITPYLMQGVMKAFIHLQYLLERSLVAALGGDAEETTAAKQHLAMFPDHEIKHWQAELTKHLNRQAEERRES